MKSRALAVLFLAALPALAAAQPRYTAEFLGPFPAGKLNSRGAMVSGIQVGSATRALVVRAGAPHELLPLPAGMTSSIALDLNDGGVIVGAVSPSTSPEFSGRAAAWTPDGSGGYTVRLLGELPGHAVSRASHPARRASSSREAHHSRPSRRALTATITVESDISAAPTAGLRTTPTPVSTPAASGIAITL